MLHRSTSSRRRRASRSNASPSSPQARSPRSGTSPGRRASIAVSPIDFDMGQRNTLAPEINRSPRHSIIPDISLDTQEESSPEETPICRSPRHSITPEMLSPRNSLVPDANRSPRQSLVPGDYHRSPRNSLVPDSALSPRNSLVPDSALSPRNSLVPDSFSRSPRNSLTPEALKSPRGSLVPDYNRSPRHSLVPESNGYGSRLNLSPDYSRSPRNSLLPDGSRSPRNLAASESSTWNQGSPEEIPSRSPRHSIVPDPNRSPRGSIAPERTSPRGSIASEYNGERSPRGSIAGDSRTPRERSPRGSLTLTFQEPPASGVRRYSADNTNGPRGRSTSPYRGKGSVNMGYNSNPGLSEGGSRRASSSVSQVGLQVSGDEQRRLCSEQKYIDGELGLGIGLSLTTYGSVAYQLKDANLEANSTCDFICKALSIVNKTVVVTVVLVCLSTLPLIMLIMGIQFLRDCPREPHIPIYMVVGGTVGCIKMSWVLWNQLHTRQMELGVVNPTSIVTKLGSFALTMFLVAWFSLGNYWILKIKWPDYSPTLFEPNRWCHRTLYVFAIVHLCIAYFSIGAVLLFVIILALCQLFGCPWLGPTRYK